MPKEIVNNPEKSRWIGRMFIILTMFTAFIFIITSYYVGQESTQGQNVINAIMIGVMSMVLITTGSFYNTKYKVRNGVLTAWSPFVSFKIRLKDIKSVERTVFPFGFRVGASFYSGFYYVPSLGWVSVVITNMKDVILIRTKDGKKYMISPKNPKRFIGTLKKK